MPEFSLSPEELLAYKRAQEKDSASEIGDFSAATTPHLMSQAKSYSQGFDAGASALGPIMMDPAVQSNTGTENILGAALAEEEEHFRMAGDALWAQSQIEIAKRKAAAQREAQSAQIKGQQKGNLVQTGLAVAGSVVSGFIL